ncbi:transcription factor bHLH30-like [Rutidosis leptorrhynchoides]|uniref:transcription factor bHLH30-like n=1 Tax=Rutidosis leptorrhynchoides TaxID=125765 RepID=UPI003A99E458
MEFPPNCFKGFSSSEEYALKEMMMMTRRGGVRTTSSSSSSLVLDSEKGEIVRALVTPGSMHHHNVYSHNNNNNNNNNNCNEKGVKAEKALMALRNHSEAERRRRERINGHLSMLRSLIPGTNKMDKASLLAEVIIHLKKLRRNCVESTKGVLIPMDIDEVKVEEQDDNTQDESSYSIRASLCCEYKHEVLSDLKEALDGLHLKTIRSEIATLGGRMINLFVITGSKHEVNISDIVSSVQQALKSVLDKFYASQEFSESNSLSNKRRRVSFFTPSNSSSLGDFW